MRYSTSAIINSPQSPLKLATKKKRKRKKSVRSLFTFSWRGGHFKRDSHGDHPPHAAGWLYIPQFGPFSRFHLNSHRAKIPKTKNLERVSRDYHKFLHLSPPFLLLSSSSLRLNGVDVFLDLLIGRKGNYVRPFEWSAKRADWLSLLTL